MLKTQTEYNVSKQNHLIIFRLRSVHAHVSHLDVMCVPPPTNDGDFEEESRNKETRRKRSSRGGQTGAAEEEEEEEDEEEEEEETDTSAGREEIVISSLHIGNRIRPSCSSSLQVTSLSTSSRSIPLYLSICLPVCLPVSHPDLQVILRL